MLTLKSSYSQSELFEMFETNNFICEAVLDRKKDWKKFPSYYLKDKAVKEVLLINKNGGGYFKVGKSHPTTEFLNYLNTLQSKHNVEIISDGAGGCDIIGEYGFEGNNNSVWRDKKLHKRIVTLLLNGVQITLVPYYDGVKIASIVVNENERGNGKGTEVMNLLYDISEELEIPLYVNPYPASDYEPSKEKEVVTKLINWYEDLGFGNVWDKIWCNF